jgi:hypothetical protein
VRWHGHRWVGVAVPTSMQLGSITAYSAHGEIARTFPFGHSEYNLWLRPGQRGLPRQTVAVGSGTLNGKRWSMTGKAGPWGLCFQQAGGSGGDCFGDLGSRLRKGTLTRDLTCGSGQVAIAQAATTVSYLRIRLSDGSVQQAPTARLGGYRYYAFAEPAKAKIVGWTAYDASGQRLGSGSGKAFRPC